MSQQQSPAGPQRVDPLLRGCGIGCLAVVVLAVVLAVAGYLAGRGDDDQSAYVKIACRDWVKERLKAPATAHFSAESVSQSGDTYTVTGAVDSENSFGAKIRNTYRCVATHDGESSRLVSLTGLDH